MADRYWVGGTGTWDTSSTTNWAASSGGASGASVPTAADNVIFDSATTYTVTLTGALTCLSFTVSAGTVTFSSTGTLAISGSMSLAVGTVWSATGNITFNSTTTGNTVTTNNISMASAIVFNGVGGAWGFGSNCTSTGSITLSNGSLTTNNYNLTATSIVTNGPTTATLTLGSSTITLSNTVTFNPSTVVDAGTSSMVILSYSPTFVGGGKTFYNVSFTSGAAATATKTISGTNTYNNLTFASASTAAVYIISLSANQTVLGTLTLGTSSTATTRTLVRSTVLGTPRTLTVATVAALSEVDFRDIVVAGASSPWSGTRLGNCGGNTNITFAAGVTKYWNLVGGGNWSSTAWALSSGGAVAVANFPLPQDTIIIGDTGLNAGATITFNATSWSIGNFDASGRTLAATLAFSSTISIYGDFKLSSAITPSGTIVATTSGRTTQNISFAGRTLTNPWTFSNTGGLIAFASGITVTNTVTLSQGTIQFLAGSTNTATTFVVAGGAATPVFLTSSTPGTQATLSQATGTVTASNATISDSNATGGATWLGPSASNAIDAGNNTGWVFDIPYGGVVFQQPVRLRSFTERGRD
jgi:hypothetical protein